VIGIAVDFFTSAVVSAWLLDTGKNAATAKTAAIVM
jgi:hypothetical protein